MHFLSASIARKKDKKQTVKKHILFYLGSLNGIIIQSGIAKLIQ